MRQTSKNSTSGLIGVSISLILLALLCTSYTARHPFIGEMFGGIFIKLSAPLDRANSYITGFTTKFKNDYFDIFDLKTKYNSLLRREEMLEAKNVELDELKVENRRLRLLLRMKSNANLEGIAAKIIGSSLSYWSKTVTVDRGSTSGINVGMPVVSTKGVVGQVTAVSSATAKVLLLTDPANGVDGLLQQTRSRGVVEGKGGEECEMKYVAREVEVQVGERVITSGFDGVYPKGLLIGKVIKVGKSDKGIFHSVTIDPAVSFNDLEEVLIIPNN